MWGGFENLPLWWSQQQHIFPGLASLARKIFVVPASQAASERDFSQMRLLATHLRSNLDPEKVWKMSLVRSVLRSNPRHGTVRVHSRPPVTSAAKSKAHAKRVANAKRRLDQITPNPDPDPSSVDDPEVIGIPDLTDNGERSSDDDYEEPDDQDEGSLNFGSDIDLDDSSPTTEVHVPLINLSSRSNTRSSKVGCHITSGALRWHYTACFKNLGNRSIPPANLVFGELYRYIDDWSQLNIHNTMVYRFQATEEAQEKFKSASRFLAALEPLIDLSSALNNME